MSAPAIPWSYLQDKSTDFVRDELDRAVRLELHMRKMAKADPRNAATYRLSAEHAKQRADAAQAELDRRQPS